MKILITGGLGYVGTQLCKLYTPETSEKEIVVSDRRFLPERVKELKYNIRRIDKGKEKILLEREVENRSVYLINIAKYFDTSTWLDLFYGKDQDHKVTYRPIAYAYDEEGYIKTNASITD